MCASLMINTYVHADSNTPTCSFCMGKKTMLGAHTQTHTRHKKKNPTNCYNTNSYKSSQAANGAAATTNATKA